MECISDTSFKQGVTDANEQRFSEAKWLLRKKVDLVATSKQIILPKCVSSQKYSIQEKMHFINSLTGIPCFKHL